MQVLKIYYAATAIFLMLDYVLGVNVRLAFLTDWPGWRILYYVFCFGCFGVIVWRPALTTLVTTIESLITLSALILGFGIRAMGMSVAVLDYGGGIITVEEVVNFLISGTAAWIGWYRGSRALSRRMQL